jgi:hypothetical protein
MPILPILSVVFVGIGGSDAAKVDHQMQSLLHKDARVESVKVSPQQLHTLVHHGDGARAIVRGLHAEGVVGGELIADHGQLTLRVVVYDGDGGMKDLVETPLTARQLARADIESLRSNLMPDVVELVHAQAGGDEIVMNDDQAQTDDAPPALPIKKPTTHAAAPATSHRAAAATQPEHPAQVDDGEGAPGIDAGKAHDGDSHDAAPTETADASDSVSADEAMALATGTDNEETGGGSVSASTSTGAALHMRAAVGIGFTARDFAPGPSTVAGYSSTPVGNIRLDAEIQPTERLALGLVAERSLGMTTPGLMGGDAPTSSSRWQVAASYNVGSDKLSFAPMAGVGERVFAIDSSDPSRSPDGRYGYLVFGAQAKASLGERIVLGALAAVEPVIGGAESTEMQLGAATRWALEIGGSIDVRATQHIFVRAAGGMQRFSWTWDQAGARGAGGAVDIYPTGTLSLGADY